MAEGPKSVVKFSVSRCQLAADRLAAAAVVDARFALAVWTLTFGPFAVETSVPSDACHPWHWPLSALVTVGAGRCEKPHSSTEQSNARQKSRFLQIPDEGLGGLGRDFQLFTQHARNMGGSSAACGSVISRACIAGHAAAFSSKCKRDKRSPRGTRRRTGY